MTSKHSSTSRLLNTNLFDGLNSFTDIEARISALPSNKERGDAFEIFAEAYLATQKIAQAQEVWPFEAIPLEQRKTLSLDTGRDMGVDGTYLTIDGELRAYQVKFRSNRPSLTWDELSTFMGLTDQVSQRVLFTNCEALPSLMQDRSGFVAIRGSDLDRLEAEDFEAMRLWLRSGQVKLPRKQPKEHQQEALIAISSGLVENDRATVVMACGTGKSLVALWAAEKHDCKTLLVLVPSLALVRQLLHEWLRETAWERLTFMCVCSDPTVAKGADDLVVHQADLDFPVTTDSAVVSRFLGKTFDGVKIVFSTYQSAHVVAEGLPVGADGVPQPFDLAIFDEAHKTASREGTRFSFALEDANLPIRKRLFFTATPRHYDIRKKDKEGDNTLVYSMDRPEVYGPVIHTLSFAEAARRGIICDYKVVISVVTSEMVNDHVLKHGEVIVAGDTVKARQVALQIALQKAVEKYGVSRIFTFHGSVAAARSFTSDDGEGIRHHLPDFTTLHVSGEMPTARREDQMKTFRQSEKAVISNARCLTEGVDVPAVDMIAFISPRKSKVDIVQATGRAMRKSPGKEFGYVMVPLFVEQAANESIEEALQRTGFDDIWDLLGAMREQDDVLTDIIRQMREDKGRTGGYDESRFSERVEVLGPSVSLDTIRESITAECLESLGVSWDERFGELLAYKAEHGDTNVHQHWPAGLGSWVSNQRVAWKKQNLAPERKKRLEEIEFEWDPLVSQWEAMFAELLIYKNEHGDLKVPQNWSTGLGSWIRTQRATINSLSVARKARLEALPGWSWDILSDQWEDAFGYLEEFVEMEGHAKPSSRYRASDDFRLGQWVTVQRLKKDTMPLERRERLEALPGWAWALLDEQWDVRFRYLMEFTDEVGHAKVPKDFKTTDGYQLGQWVGAQRRLKDTMPLERKNRLESLRDWVWDTKDDAWDVGFQHLKEFSDREGHCNVSRNYKSEDGYLLGSWLGNQRIRRDELPTERKVKLESLQGWTWNVKDAAWDIWFRYLTEFTDEVGHAKVPKDFKTTDGYQLGQWVGTQRQLKDTMPLERKNRLESLRDWVWDTKDDAWDVGFQHLKEFSDREGHCNVPRDYKTEDGYLLGSWLGNQRIRRDELPTERKVKLESLQGWSWNVKDTAWDTWFGYLKEYVEREGHCTIAAKYQTTEGHRLGSWVSNQRKIRDEMPQERKAQLETLPGWNWDAIAEKWEVGFRHLQEFSSREGHCRIPVNYQTPDGYRLGTWLSGQRYKKDSLLTEQKKRLGALPGWVWDDIAERWEIGFRYLKEFANREGHCKVFKRYVTPDGYRLGQWVQVQRSSWESMSTERKERLAALPDWNCIRPQGMANRKTLG